MLNGCPNDSLYVRPNRPENSTKQKDIYGPMQPCHDVEKAKSGNLPAQGCKKRGSMMALRPPSRPKNETKGNV